MNEDYMKTVEINGVKLEVDMRTARKIESYKIGDRVKVLVKQYSSYKPFPGVIVAFDMFEKRPTITVAYLEESYSSTDIKFAYIADGTKDEDQPELAPYHDDVQVNKADVLDTLQAQIEKKKAEIDDIESKKAYFVKHFDRYFSQTSS